MTVMSQKQASPQLKRLERRLKMLRNHLRGVEPSVWVDLIATEYNMKSRTVWRDWNRRENWQDTIIRLSDPNAVVKELLQTVNMLVQDGYVLYGQCLKQNNLTAAVGAHRSIRETVEAAITLMQSTGQVNTAPLRIEGKLDLDLRDYAESVRRATEHNIKAARSDEQVDSTQSNTETS